MIEAQNRRIWQALLPSRCTSIASCASPLHHARYDAFGNVKKDYYVDSQQYPGTTFLAKYSNSYPNNRFQTVPASTCPLQYDSNGNLLCDGTHTYTWDLDNRLTTIDGGTPSLFDAFDRRVEFNGISQLLYPPFDPGYHLGIASQQALGGIRLPLPGGIQAIYNSTGLAEYRIANWQTSEPLTVTPSHTVTIDSHYSPFGEPYAGVSGGYNGFFAGMYAISAHGFIGDSYEANFRLYNYQQGRWISPDPAGLAAVDLTNPQSFNRYAYALNDPLQFMDPIGLQGVNCGAGRHWQANSNGDGGQCVGDQPNPGTTLYINSCAQLLLYAPQYAYLCAASPGHTGPNGPIGGTRPDWLNNITSIFGYDENIPLPSCFGGFLKDTLDNLNPIPPSLSSLGEGLGEAYGFAKLAQGVKYAATRPSKAKGTPFLVRPASRASSAASAPPQVRLELLDS
jgi:RHS repeat-associated protein